MAGRSRGGGLGDAVASDGKSTARAGASAEARGDDVFATTESSGRPGEQAPVEPELDAVPPTSRDRLLEAGARRMALHGYPGTSVREIAADAGLTTGAIYARFPGGKEELFRAILTSVTDEVHQLVAVSVLGASDPVDFVVRQAGGLWDFFEHRPSYAALVVRENLAGALGDPSPFVADTEASVGHMRALFAAAIAEGRMAPVNVSHVMFWVTSTCMTFHGCRPLRDTLCDADDRASARESFLGALRAVLTPA